MATSIGRFCHSSDVEAELKFEQKKRGRRLSLSKINNNIALRLRTADQHVTVARCIVRCRCIVDGRSHECGFTPVADPLRQDHRSGTRMLRQVRVHCCRRTPTDHVSTNFIPVAWIIWGIFAQRRVLSAAALVVPHSEIARHEDCYLAPFAFHRISSTH